MQMLYWDDYERIDGRWLFRRRLPCYWYATDLNQPPIGTEKMRWPDRERYDGAFHDLFPSWEEFWAHPPGDDEPAGRRAGAARAVSRHDAPRRTRPTDPRALNRPDRQGFGPVTAGRSSSAPHCDHDPG